MKELTYSIKTRRFRSLGPLFSQETSLSDVCAVGGGFYLLRDSSYLAFLCPELESHNLRK